MEAEIKSMEKDGAKDSDVKARQKAMDKEETLLRERFDAELDVLKRAWDEFQGLHSRKIIEDENLWREIKDRYQDYFTGGTGADAIKQLIDSIDFDEEEVGWEA